MPRTDGLREFNYANLIADDMCTPALVELDLYIANNAPESMPEISEVIDFCPDYGLWLLEKNYNFGSGTYEFTTLDNETTVKVVDNKIEQVVRPTYSIFYVDGVRVRIQRHADFPDRTI